MKDAILILIPTFNRKKITEISLEQTYKNKRTQDFIQVYDDHSTDYPAEHLTKFCNEVVILPQKMGIHYLRWYQFKFFLKTKYKFLYMTDSDMFHDQSYISKLLELYFSFEVKLNDKKSRLPVTLYNSIFHNHPNNLYKEYKNALVRKTAPGASMFFDRAMVEVIVKRLDQQVSWPNASWDYIVSDFLRLPFITPKISYVEHFGAGGLHNAESDYDRCRASNPSEFLKEARKELLEYLLGNKKN